MLKFIFILVVLFFVFGKVIKYALKYLIISSVQKQQYQQGQPQKEQRKEGSIHIDTNPKKEKGKNDGFKDGDYVDYEVVK